ALTRSAGARLSGAAGTGGRVPRDACADAPAAAGGTGASGTGSGRLAACGAGARRLGDLDETTGLHVVDVAVDGDPAGHERMLTDARDVVDDALRLVLDGQPLDVLGDRRSGAAADVAESVGS